LYKNQSNDQDKIIDKKRNLFKLDSSKLFKSKNSISAKDSDNLESFNCKNTILDQNEEDLNQDKFKKYMISKIKKNCNNLVFENEKLIPFKNIRFQINSNFKNTCKSTFLCQKCSNCNNESNINNNFNISENNTSIAYSDISKYENREINQELYSLRSLLNHNFEEEFSKNNQQKKGIII